MKCYECGAMTPSKKLLPRCADCIKELKRSSFNISVTVRDEQKRKERIKQIESSRIHNSQL